MIERIQLETLEKILWRVEKPARYTGGELNVIKKENCQVHTGLCYPDLYEVGMSNNGIQILYSAANSLEDVACERVFSVAPDLEKALRDENLPLYTLETRIPLASLDMLAFNVAHELLFTNILQVLDLGGIPLRSEEREDHHPVVMAGGEAVSNPAALTPFIDAFFMGDGEEGMVDICNELLRGKKNARSRDDILKDLAEIEGVYVPGISSTVRKRVFRSDSGSDPLLPVVPGIRVAQERVVMEVNRGCMNLCKFCHAGYYDLPYRKIPWEPLAEKVFTLLDNTGYDEVSFASLCINDYPYLARLLNAVLPGLTRRGVSIALPSLRVEPQAVPVIELISDVRRASLTFAVESATEELRKRAFKRLHTGDIISIIQQLYDRGWQRVKLYFMIGLPGYREHDEADDIISLLNEIYQVGKHRLQLNVTVSPFIPKPHTPFQDQEQADTGYLLETIQKIKRGVPRKIKVKNHDVYHSLLEGVFSRGDSRLADVMEHAYRDGCRLDSWSEHFNFSTWQHNLDTYAPGWQNYLQQQKGGDGYPWSMVQTGYEKLVEKKTNSTWDGKSLPKSFDTTREPLNTGAVGEAMEQFEQKYPVVSRVRIRISKTGIAKFIPHIDFMEIIKRALRMAHVPVSFTQGFNKRERISMGYALPLGTESEAEYLDIELYNTIEPNDLPQTLNTRLPEGIQLTGAVELSDNSSLSADVVAMEYVVMTADTERMSGLVSGMKEEPSLTKETKKGLKTIACSDAIVEWGPVEEGVRLLLTAGLPESVRADKIVLQVCKCDDLSAFNIKKISQLRKTEKGLVSIY